jgi:hypothetical protein
MLCFPASCKLALAFLLACRYTLHPLRSPLPTPLQASLSASCQAPEGDPHTTVVVVGVQVQLDPQLGGQPLAGELSHDWQLVQGNMDVALRLHAIATVVQVVMMLYTLLSGGWWGMYEWVICVGFTVPVMGFLGLLLVQVLRSRSSCPPCMSCQPG